MLRHVAMQQALDAFSEQFSVNVVYYPEQVEGRTAYCLIEDAEADAALSCVLGETGLDYYRLSSGTYVIVSRAAQPPRLGTLNGTVVDALTGAPLPHAQVVLASAETGAVANDAGHFAFAALAPGPYVAYTTYLGYDVRRDTLVVEPDGHTRYRIALAPTTVSLDPVIIDGTQERRLQTTLTQIELSGELLTTGAPVLGLTNVLNTLDDVPGVDVGPTSADIHIQGGGAGEVETRLDGSPIFTPPHMGGLFGPFSPLALQRLTVYKSGFGASVGSETSGVVLADHTLGDASRPGLDAKVDVQSANVAIHGGVPLGERRVQVMGAFRRSLWAWYRPPAFASYLRERRQPDFFLLFENPAVNRNNPNITKEVTATAAGPEIALAPEVSYHDLHLAAQVQLGPLHTLRTSYYRGSNHLSSATRVLDTSAPPSTVRGEVSPFSGLSDTYRWSNSAAQVSAQSILGARLLGQLRLRHSRFYLTHTYSAVNALRTDNLGRFQEFEAPSTTDHNEVDETALETDLSYAIHPQHMIEVGAVGTYARSTYRVTASNTLTTIDGATGRARTLANPLVLAGALAGPRVAFYVQDRFQATPRLLLEPGVRATWLPAQGRTYVEPRLSLHAQHSDSRGRVWDVSAAVGLYRQFTGRFDLSTGNTGTLLPTLRFWIPLDDSGMSPPKAYHASLRIGQTPGLLSWAAESYVKYYPHTLVVPHGLTQRPGPGSRGATLAVDDFLTAGRALATGLTLSSTAALGRVTLRGEVAWSYARQQSPDRFAGRYVPVPWTTPLNVTAGINWTVVAGLEAQLTSRAGWRRAAGLSPAYYDYLAGAPQPKDFSPYALDDPEDHRLPPFHRVDARVTYAARIQQVEVSLSAALLNALDRANVDYWRLVYDLDAAAYTPDAITSQRRLSSLALRVSW
ncbi:MAG: TonB-dependent receptor [Bacteroidota bacterium]